MRGYFGRAFFTGCVEIAHPGTIARGKPQPTGLLNFVPSVGGAPVVADLGEAEIDSAVAAGWEVRRTCFHCSYSDWLDLHALQSAGFGNATMFRMMQAGQFDCPACHSRYVFVGSDRAGLHDGSFLWQHPYDPIDYEVKRVRVHTDRKLEHVPFLIEEGPDRRPYVDLTLHPEEIGNLPEVILARKTSLIYGGKNRLRALLTDINKDGVFQTLGCALILHKPSAIWSGGGYVNVCWRDWSRNTFDAIRQFANDLLEQIVEKVEAPHKVELSIHPVQFQLQPHFLIAIQTFCFGHSRKAVFLQSESVAELIRVSLLELGRRSFSAER